MRLQLKELTLLPALIVAACLTIAYPRRFALGTTAIGALLVVQTVRGEIGLFLTLLAGLSMTVYLLNDIRSRTQIISAGFITAVAVFAVTFALGLIDRQGPAFVARTAGLAAASAIAAALVVQGVLPFIERVFRIATSLTLVEWSMADKPLLQRLAREAPGTYNHSLTLGTFAEAACEAIGANGLLVRVGALYHDIGKMHKADYFAENQEASISRHDNLSASMSLLIILGHVKDGVELAREYGLPRVLYQFIEEHHGTTLVRYFHHKASEKQPQIASGKHDREVPEAEFRYPGPKPRSKESAILLQCDGVEGAVRALAEPTAGRIESVVHQILMARLNDGQFGNCDITLKELQTVEDSLVKSLCTFYHGRVTYPKAAPPKEEGPRREAAEAAEAQAEGRADESAPQADTQPEQRQPA
ncbi:MAG: HDIG domain-containing metalloprotein, partial [Planctomycetota bacterium]|jgi:putative nucleotidyltransferase with HDIG domain